MTSKLQPGEAAKLQRTADYGRTSSEDKAHGYDAMGNLLGVRQILHREGAKDNGEDTTHQLTPGEGYLQTAVGRSRATLPSPNQAALS